MTDTPISNAAASTTMFIDGEPVVEIKICRELERELQKAQADAAAMREALNAIPFPCPCCSYATMHAGSCAIGSALSTNAGRELLEELQRLRQLVSTIETETCENCNYQRNIYTPCKCGQFSVVGTNARLRAELKSTREEVERARSDRNKAGVEERRKYLPKIQELTGELTKAQAQCAEKDAALKRCLPNWEIEPDDADGHICCEITNGDVRAIKSALSPDCGRDYVHRSEVERLRSEVQRAYYEGHIHAISSDPELDPQEHSWPNSRARKIATGELK